MQLFDHGGRGDEDTRPLVGASGRKGSKKVRSGCITCKIRKVKCDEVKPYCQRCTKTGRKCDGYLDDAALAIRRRRRRRPMASPLEDPLVSEQQAVAHWTPAAVAGAPSSVLPSMTPPWSATMIPRMPGSVLLESAQEKRSFEFFQHITAPILAGDLDAVFWRVLVLQICHTEPAVRHAVLAISSLHEALLRISALPPTGYSSKITASSSPPNFKNSTAHQHDFALQQYNKAIAYLLEDMKMVNGEPGVDHTSETVSNACTGSFLPLQRPVAPLMTCVLLVCIEVMQGKDRDALIHLDQGRHLLGQLDSSRLTITDTSGDLTPSSSATRRAATKGDADPEMAVVSQHLVPLYTRLSMTSFLFGGNPEPIPSSLKGTTAGRTPDTFDTIHALRAAVHDFLDDVLRFTQRTRPIKYPTTAPQRRASSSSYVSSHPPSSSSSSPPLSPLSPSSLVSIQSPPLSAPTEDRESKPSPPLPQTSIALCELEADRQALSTQLDRLRVALSLFRVNQSAVVTASANPNAAALALLQIHLYIAEIWLATALTRAETAFDAHLETFSTVVSLTVTVLEAEQQQRQKQQQQQNQKHHRPGDTASATPSVFTLETHVIPALYYVATKCRHGLVRHAALALLTRNGGRRENLWRADVLGAIASRIIEIEEGYVTVEKEDVKREPVGAFSNAVKEKGIRQATFTCANPSTIPHQNELPLDFGLHSLPTFASAEATVMDTVIDMPIADLSTATIPTELDQWDFGEQLCGSEDSFLMDHFFFEEEAAPVSRRSWHGSVTENEGAAEEQAQVPAKASVSSPSPTPCIVSSAATPMPGYSKNRSTEAPFDVPEQVRVHTAVIGPEEVKGRWVTLFRKLEGLGGVWDVRAEFVAS